jgi:hypothetical protein
MRISRTDLIVFAFAAAVTLPVTACDDKKAQLEAMGNNPVREASAPPPAQEAGAPEAGARAMPPRPVPKESPTVGSGMSDEIQMRAITYMAAMRAPGPDDPNVDTAYAADLVKKLGPVARGLDKGPDKERLNRVENSQSPRQIDILMSVGCDAELPVRAVVQGAGVPLATLHQHGILVIRCNDSRFQCLQSTREPTDILCTTAPRKK